MIEENTTPLVVIDGLRTYFGRSKQPVRAVDGVDLVIPRGKTVGLVGESGSGKTTVGRTILKLIPATAGKVSFDGHNVFDARGRHLRQLRQRMQMIFQDPVSSLNPRMTVGNIIAEPLRVHFRMTRAQRRQRVAELLGKVELSPAYINRYPHEFSGGQRQRIGIARALASQPDFIVCDEPVSALDVSIQAQILNLLSNLQDQLGLSYLFVAHDLAVVEHFADIIAVMYLGRIVEIASKQTVLGRHEGKEHLRHPYSLALLSSIPIIDPENKRPRVRLTGEMPSPLNPPSGCAFHPRCPLTAKLASEASESETTEIATQSGTLRVMKRCTLNCPQLLAVNNDTIHKHSCKMLH